MPPNRLLLPSIVIPDIITIELVCKPSATTKVRNAPPALSIVNIFSPGPLILIDLVTNNVSEIRIVCGPVPGILKTTSPPGSTSAMACLSDPGPASFMLVTVSRGAAINDNGRKNIANRNEIIVNLIFGIIMSPYRTDSNFKHTSVYSVLEYYN